MISIDQKIRSSAFRINTRFKILFLFSLTNLYSHDRPPVYISLMTGYFDS